MSHEATIAPLSNERTEGTERTPAREGRTETTTKTRSIARHAPTVARVLLGLVFFVFGLDYFLHFMPAPKGPFPPGAMALGGAMMQSGYMFELIKGTEVVCGLLLVSGLFVPLALVVIAPVVVNIFAFHAFLEPAGIPMAVILVALLAYLGWAYRDTFRPLLALRVKPAR
jgi:uncharacterized membrane protein YphA (DoxX/SURF4 family)